jgi:hypothetical protein
MAAVFWGEAVVMAVYILNRSPTKALEGRTPYEAWHGPSRRSPTCGSSAASLLPRSLATSASSTTGAFRECSPATWKARRPIASLTRRHVCARRTTLCSTKGEDGCGTRRWMTAQLRLTTISLSSTSTSRKLGEWAALLRRECLSQSPSLHRLRHPLRRQHHVLEPRLEPRCPLLQRLHVL